MTSHALKYMVHAGRARNGAKMVGFDNRLFCSLNTRSATEQEQQRHQALSVLGLLEAESIPVFEEATQMAARFVDAPISILGILNGDRHCFKSAVGLSRIGLMNDLATSRQLPRHESFCTHVVSSQRVLAVEDLSTDINLSHSLLVHTYGIRAYLGVPLTTSDGQCLGALEVMALKPREFTDREIELVEMTARWCMSEFERNHLLKQHSCSGSCHNSSDQQEPIANGLQPAPDALRSVKTDLITQMTQELRTPLTSILGMASVLHREVYGPLTEKQKEYMDIVHNSGQYLLMLVNEILDLGTLNAGTQSLVSSQIDIEMLCQQAIGSLKQAAQRRDQQLHLTVEPGPRIWLLDKEKVRQMLYHLVFSIIQSSSADSTIRLHVSRKRNSLNITIWTSHPWLGEGLPQSELFAHPFLSPFRDKYQDIDFQGDQKSSHEPLISDGNIIGDENETLDQTAQKRTSHTRRNLGLLLSQKLAEAHGGTISLQGNTETGYRYLITLPEVKDNAIAPE